MTRGICLCPGFSVRFDARRLCTKRRLSTPPSAFRKEWLVEIWTGVAGWAWCRAALFRSDFGRSMLSTCFGRPHRRSQGKWLGGFGHPLTRATTIDKAFRIAKPMRKASWTKRFAAGWGERRAANGLLSLVRAVVGTWPPV